VTQQGLAGKHQTLMTFTIHEVISGGFVERDKRQGERHAGQGNTGLIPGSVLMCEFCRWSSEAVSGFLAGIPEVPESTP